MIWDVWRARWDLTLAQCRLLGDISGKVTIGPPAKEADVVELEQELGRRLPTSFRQILTQFSAEVEFFWFLPDHIHLPDTLSQIFSGDCGWSLSRLKEIEKGRNVWVELCFRDPEDEYDRVWHDKLAFHEVGNGDLLALDIGRPESPVVYLSHDGGEGHGYQLGADFIDFVDRWTLLGCPGAEEWQVTPFLASPTSYLDPFCENADLFRRLMGLEGILALSTDDARLQCYRSG